jgi:hypothetical protein
MKTMRSSHFASAAVIALLALPAAALATVRASRWYGQTGRFHRGGWRRIAIQASVAVIWRTERYVDLFARTLPAVAHFHFGRLPLYGV